MQFNYLFYHHVKKGLTRGSVRTVQIEGEPAAPATDMRKRVRPNLMAHRLWPMRPATLRQRAGDEAALLVCRGLDHADVSDRGSIAFQRGEQFSSVRRAPSGARIPARAGSELPAE